MNHSSQLGWVDFSADDRERVKDVLSRLNEPGTLDELGIGVLRDAFADLLFPGFSTIQTRGKYLVIIPRIIREFLALKPSERKGTSLAAYLKEEEDNIARLLAERHTTDNETGIIGSTKVGSDGVLRRPSSVYWGALRQWGIIQTSASLAQFCRVVSAPETTLGLSGEEEADDSDALVERHKVHLDSWQPRWRDDLSLYLTESESSFLKEKFLQGPFTSIPTQLFAHNLMTQALEERHEDFEALAAWLVQQKDVEPKTRTTLQMAMSFSDLVYGAHLRLNCLLAEKNRRESQMQNHCQAWDDWFRDAQPEEDSIQNWLEHTETGARMPKFTRDFLRAWCDAVRLRAPLSKLDTLIQRQSEENKRQRSIFLKSLPDDYQWFGMARLGYRWSQVRVILADIQKGLPC